MNEFYKSMDMVELSYVDKSSELTDTGLARRFFYDEGDAMRFVENIKLKQGDTWFIIESVEVFKFSGETNDSKAII